MASTVRDDEDKEELFDPPDVLDLKATQMAEWIRESRHMIAFTGAGISTSAGIPDFRSGMNTSVATGPGKWELQAHRKERSSKIKTTTTTQAIPTPTHMMLVKLVEEGLLKAVVSQNCDGLHRRSGLPVASLFELHGNSNVERCKKCKRRYLRDFRVGGNKKHLTGRKCDDKKCGGDLRNTIINFGESLPQLTMERSFKHGEEADLCLAMGSSLTVTPAADIPEIVGKKNNLVIVNLQRTPLDKFAALRVFAKCDDFTKLVMEKLGLEIPEFRLKRRLFFKAQKRQGGGGKVKVLVEQVDAEGNPFSYLKSVTFGGVVSKSCDPTKDLLECDVPAKGGEVKVQMVFHSHYGEPDLALSFPVKPGQDVMVEACLSYNPFTGAWSVQRSDDPKAEVLSGDPKPKAVSGDPKVSLDDPKSDVPKVLSGDPKVLPGDSKVLSGDPKVLPGDPKSEGVFAAKDVSCDPKQKSSTGGPDHSESMLSSAFKQLKVLHMDYQNMN